MQRSASGRVTLFCGRASGQQQRGASRERRSEVQRRARLDTTLGANRGAMADEHLGDGGVATAACDVQRRADAVGRGACRVGACAEEDLDCIGVAVLCGEVEGLQARLIGDMERIAHAGRHRRRLGARSGEAQREGSRAAVGCQVVCEAMTVAVVCGGGAVLAQGLHGLRRLSEDGHVERRGALGVGLRERGPPSDQEVDRRRIARPRRGVQQRAAMRVVRGVWRGPGVE